MPVQALCFDLDHTLLDYRDTRQALRVTCEVIATADSRLEPADIETANQAVWPQYFREVEQAWLIGELDTSLLGLEAWRRTLRACQCNDEALAILARDTLYRLQSESYRLFDDVASCLESLSPHLPVVLITNGASDLQRDKIRLLELEHRFDLIVISGEHGIAKPDPAVFNLVLNELGIEDARSVWHIGDNLMSDVGGAKAAGLTAVWLNRIGATLRPSDPKPDYEIASLANFGQYLQMSR